MTTREEQRDVVERLRGFDESDFYERPWSAHETMCESAEVIEELRAEITRLRASQAGGVPADDALRSKPDWHDDPVEQLAFELAFELEDAELNPNDYVTVNREKLTAIARRVLERVSPPPPATDGDALREALRGSMHALQALLNAVKTNPTMQGRQYVDLGIQVNNAIDKARTALASSPPLAAADAVEAERRLREALAPLAAFATFMDKDAPDEAYLPATVPHISLTLGQARAAATLLGFPHASDDPQFNGERLAAIRSRGTDEVENG